MEKLAKGTKEILLVNVVDRLKAITTLNGLTMKFDVYDRQGNIKMNQVTATNAGMIAQCLVDTTTGGGWAAGKYVLYLDITTGPEKPRLGPFEFELA